MSDRTYMSDLDTGNGGMSMTGFLLGAVVGAGLALLLAPATGGETRRKLGETAKKIGNRASDLVGRGGEDEGSESFRGPQGSSVGQTSERSAGGQAGEPYRSGGRREPLGGGRSPQPGTPGTSS
jgi:hypothetical protein